MEPAATSLVRRACLRLAAACMLIAGCDMVVGDLPEPAPEPVASSGGTGGAGDDSGDGAGDAETDSSVSSDSEAGAGGQGGAMDSAAEGAVEAGCADPCDCDNDGARATGQCGGNDCDDDDGRVHAGQDEYFPEASGGIMGFDYDCSSSLDRDPTLNKVVNCGALSIANCNQTKQGFIGSAPECGMSASWGACRANGLVCETDVMGQVVMKCH